MHWSIGAKLARRYYGRSVREDPYSTFCCDFGLLLLDGLCNLSKEIELHCSSFEGDSEMSINTLRLGVMLQSSFGHIVKDVLSSSNSL